MGTPTSYLIHRNTHTLPMITFNTANSYCSVTLSINNTIISEYHPDIPYRQPQLDVPIIDNTLLESGLSIGNLRFISFSSIYGSYTGIRLGISMSQSLTTHTNLSFSIIPDLETATQAWFGVKDKTLLVIKTNGYMRISNYHNPNAGIVRWSRRSNPYRLKPFLRIYIRRTPYVSIVIASNIDLLVYLEVNDAVTKLRAISIKEFLLLTAKPILPIGLYRLIRGVSLLADQLIPPKHVYLTPPIHMQ